MARCRKPRNRHQGTDCVDAVREYWERECQDLSPSCIATLGNVINDFERHAWEMHEGALRPKPDDVAKRNIERVFRETRETFIDMIGSELADRAYRSQISRGQAWFSANTAKLIGDALVNALLEGYTGRDVIESILAQTNLSIVTIRHYLYELAR